MSHSDSTVRTRLTILVALAALTLTSGAAAQHDHTSPYAGEEPSGIAALTAAELSGLLAGEGLGFARAAELNSYPGPKHALELASELALTETVRLEIEAIRARMEGEAQELGASVVEAERMLDRRFAHSHIDAGVVREMTAEIGQLLGRLRAVHLVAHLETRALLTDDQVARYDELRGYAEGAVGAEHQH